MPFETKAECEAALAEKPYKVTFLKKDNTVRVLYGTRDCDLIEKVVGGVPKGSRNESKIANNPQLVGVFDLEIGEHRMFNVDNLMAFDPITEADCPESIREYLFPRIPFDPEKLFMLLGGNNPALIDDWF